MRLSINKQLPYVFFSTLLLLLLPLAACSTSSPAATGEPISSSTTPPGSAIKVVTTLYPLEYFTGRIRGATFNVVNLVPPGVEAHDFEPSPADIRAIAEADLVLYNGAGFEPWMGRALESASTSGRVVEVSGSLADLRGGEDDLPGLDPHVWLDPLKAAEQAKLVRDALKQLDLANAAAYDAAAGQLLAGLDALHQEFVAGLADCRLDHFVSTHIAFAYLAKRYGLEQVSISGLSPEAERPPGELARLVDELKTLGVKHVLVEPNISPKQAETLAREIGATILPLHPLESLTPDEVQRGDTYFTLMRANLANLRTALDCK